MIQTRRLHKVCTTTKTTLETFLFDLVGPGQQFYVEAVALKPGSVNLTSWAFGVRTAGYDHWICGDTAPVNGEVNGLFPRCYLREGEMPIIGLVEGTSGGSHDAYLTLSVKYG